MRRVFADTVYWIAVVHPKDQYHQKALQVSDALGDVSIITSEMVLVEVLNGLAEYGKNLRDATIKLTRELQVNPNVEIIAQTRSQFNDALSMYGQYNDKEWSLTDCASFQIMNENNIQEALTHDKDFEQFGFTALLRD